MRNGTKSNGENSIKKEPIETSLSSMITRYTGEQRMYVIFVDATSIIGYLVFMLSLILGAAGLYLSFKTNMKPSPAALTLSKVSLLLAGIGIGISVIGIILDP